MEFVPQFYGDAVAAILHLDGDGQRLMELASPVPVPSDAPALIRQAGARDLFSRSHAPEAALSGLYLYFGCWSEAHETAQEIHTPEGSYWHAIVHRQEPDAWNSGYWFRQVGNHAIFPALREAAVAAGFDPGPRWKPEAFIEFCEQARQRAGSELERQAREVQRAEWQLLFDYCTRDRRNP